MSVAPRTGDDRVTRSVFSARQFLATAAVNLAIVICSFLVFAHNLDVDFYADVGRSIRLTAFNVLLVSLLLTLAEGALRRRSVERPVKEILAVVRRLVHGDFTARVTPRRRRAGRDEFDAIIDGLNTVADELGGLEALRTDVVAAVSHEFKTPLTVIHTYAGLIQDPSVPDALKTQYARRVADDAQRLSQLTTSILLLSRLESQHIAAEHGRHDAGEQLRESILRFEPLWTRKNLNLKVEIEDDVMVSGDPDLLAIVWDNLVSNAIKFTDDGGTVAVALREHGDGGVEVEVSDTGPGMCASTQARVFEKFYRGPGPGPQAEHGNGLGLALVRRVVELLGGEVTVSSRPGHGSTFTVRLRPRP